MIPNEFRFQGEYEIFYYTDLRVLLNNSHLNSMIKSLWHQIAPLVRALLSRWYNDRPPH